ncbi:MEGF10_11 [Mytilus coruscus]|uniref:MEGF10_11 n=1 Tax=Mytilus coruscus TaxID=42192 RepID=A0A6J8CS37_MYTCO|nr:MEGF10_11 [Mytilus coruscus]
MMILQSCTCSISECPTGFTSKAGSICIPCPGNSYGLRCAEHCKCHHGERCDHEHGCVKLGGETISIDKSDFYTFTHVTTLLPMFPANKTENNLQTIEGGGSKGSSSKKIILYGIGGGSAISTIFLLALFVYIYRRYKLSKKKERFESIRNNIPLTQQSGISDTVEDQSQINEEGNDYEEIDESAILREPITSSNASSSSTNYSNDNSVTGGTDHDGYLHPYHSLYSSDIIQENNKEKENMNIIGMNIHGNDQFSVSVKDETFGSKHEKLVSKADNIYLDVIDKDNSSDEGDQKADCKRVVFFL